MMIKGRLIDYNYRIETDLFRLELREGTRKEYIVKRTLGDVSVDADGSLRVGENGGLGSGDAKQLVTGVTILCPPGTDFNTRERQLMLGHGVVETLRSETKRLIVPRLQRLSEQTGIAYRRSFVRQSHTNWGSCSAEGNINLSLFLMLLPSQYIDYVLLHELCHRLEMNHSPKFWAHLDRFTDGRAKQLRSAMRDYTRSISDLLVPLVAATRRRG